MANINTDLLDSLNLTPKPPPKKKDELGQEEFLKLMTAQLNNQDPLKPLESAEFFSQIAQFTTVDGIQKLNTSFDQFSTSMTSNQALQASTMVGRTVIVDGNTAFVNEQTPLNANIDLPFNTSNLKLSFYDSAGQLVREIDAGKQSKGQLQIQWDGKNQKGEMVSAGQYQIKASALVNGKPIDMATSVAARVESVVLGRGGQSMTLNLTGQNPVSIDKVKEIM